MYILHTKLFQYVLSIRSNSGGQYINIQKELSATTKSNNGMAVATSTGSIATSSTQGIVLI